MLINPSSGATKLKDACRTRWIERIDSYAIFLQLLPSLHAALLGIVSPNEDLGTEWNWDADTLTKANGFLYQLESSAFLIRFKILLEVLSCLKGLTIKLQMRAIDVMYAYREVEGVISTLKVMQNESESEFKRIFEETAALGKALHGEGYELKQPRTNKRQVHRSNVQSSCAEEYHRVSFYNEFLSYVTSDLEDRFSSGAASCTGLLHILLAECRGNLDIPKGLSDAVDFYRSDLPNASVFSTEYRMWVRKWKQASSYPEILIDVLKACDETAFPNIRVLLQLALTLPITSCESERSFSQLKLIKTSRRSTMTEDRLSALSLIKINQARLEKLRTSSNMAKLVQTFYQLHPRRMKLEFLLSD